MVFGEPTINYIQGPYKQKGLEEKRNLISIVAPFKDVWRRPTRFDDEGKAIEWEDYDFMEVSNLNTALKELQTPPEIEDLGAVGYKYLRILSKMAHIKEVVLVNTTTRSFGDKEKLTAIINPLPDNLTRGDRINISGTIKNSKNIGVPNLELDLNIGGTLEKAYTNTDGEWNVGHTLDKAGNLSIILTMTDHPEYIDVYESKNVYVRDKTRKQLTTGFILPDTQILVGDELNINGVFTESDTHLPVTNLPFELYINEKIHSLTTNYEGEWDVNYTAEQSGYHSVVLKFNGDANYEPLTIIDGFSVKDKDPEPRKELLLTIDELPEKVHTNESVTISGYVKNKESLSPVPSLDLVVNVGNDRYPVQTDSNGFWSVPHVFLEPGIFVIVVSVLDHPDYLSVSESKVIEAIPEPPESEHNIIKDFDPEEFDYNYTDKKIERAYELLIDARYNHLVIPYKMSYNQYKRYRTFYHDKLQKMEATLLYTPADPEFLEGCPTGNNPINVLYELFKEGGIGSLVSTPMESPAMGVHSLEESSVFFAGFVAGIPEGSKVTYVELPAVHAPISQDVYGKKIYYDMLNKGYLTTKYLDRVKGRVCVANSVTPSGRDLRIERVHAYTLNTLRDLLEPFIGDYNTPTTTYQKLISACITVRNELVSLGWITSLNWDITKSGSASVDISIHEETDDIIHTMNIFGDLTINDAPRELMYPNQPTE